MDFSGIWLGLRLKAQAVSHYFCESEVLCNLFDSYTIYQGITTIRRVM